MDLSDRFVRHVRQTGVVPEGAHVMVACSAGADSTALVLLLHGARRALGLSRLTVAHLDHGLRTGSRADADFVRVLASKLDLPLVEDRRDATPARGESPEAAARNIRYAFLAACAAEHGATHVATAHHLDDQAETVLHRILRGTGIHGLVGIPAVRPLREDSEVLLVRPLLTVRRKEIRTWLRAQGQGWREDPTNVDGNVRARLRNRALPVLEKCTGRDPGPLLARLAAHAASACEALRGVEDLARPFVRPGPRGIEVRAGIELLPGHVAHRALAEAVRRTRGDSAPPSTAEIERLLRILGGSTEETISGLRVSRDGDVVLLQPRGD